MTTDPGHLIRGQRDRGRMQPAPPPISEHSQYVPTPVSRMSKNAFDQYLRQCANLLPLRRRAQPERQVQSEPPLKRARRPLPVERSQRLDPGQSLPSERPRRPVSPDRPLHFGRLYAIVDRRVRPGLKHSPARPLHAPQFLQRPNLRPRQADPAFRTDHRHPLQVDRLLQHPDRLHQVVRAFLNNDPIPRRRADPRPDPLPRGQSALAEAVGNPK